MATLEEQYPEFADRILEARKSGYSDAAIGARLSAHTGAGGNDLAGVEKRVSEAAEALRKERSGGGMASKVGKFVAETGVQMAPAFAGAIKGAAAGTAMGGPIGGTIGGLAGAAAGSGIGEWIRQMIFDDKVEPSTIAYAVGTGWIPGMKFGKVTAPLARLGVKAAEGAALGGVLGEGRKAIEQGEKYSFEAGDTALNALMGAAFGAGFEKIFPSLPPQVKKKVHEVSKLIEPKLLEDMRGQPGGYRIDGPTAPPPEPKWKSPIPLDKRPVHVREEPQTLPIEYGPQGLTDAMETIARSPTTSRPSPDRPVLLESPAQGSARAFRDQRYPPTAEEAEELADRALRQSQRGGQRLRAELARAQPAEAHGGLVSRDFEPVQPWQQPDGAPPPSPAPPPEAGPSPEPPQAKNAKAALAERLQDETAPAIKAKISEEAAAAAAPQAAAESARRPAPNAQTDDRYYEKRINDIQTDILATGRALTPEENAFIAQRTIPYSESQGLQREQYTTDILKEYNESPDVVARRNAARELRQQESDQYYKSIHSEMSELASKPLPERWELPRSPISTMSDAHWQELTPAQRKSVLKLQKAATAVIDPEPRMARATPEANSATLDAEITAGNRIIAEKRVRSPKANTETGLAEYQAAYDKLVAGGKTPDEARAMLEKSGMIKRIICP